MAGRPCRRLLQELLQSKTKLQLVECLRQFGKKGCGQSKKQDLEVMLQNICQDTAIHESVCKHLLDPFRTYELNNWLVNMRKLGLNIPPKAAWGGSSKDALVATFIGADTVRPLATINATPCPNEAVTTLVVHDLAPPQLQNKLKTKWAARARRWLGKASRLKMSAALILALKETLQEYPDYTVGQVRSVVGTRVGLDLDDGDKRLFFEAQLLKLTKRPAKRNRAARPKVILKLGRGASNQSGQK